MQKRPKDATLAVMVKATHHHRGAGCSTTPEIRSVSQLKLRRCRTSGTRAISCSASSIISGDVDAPSIPYGTWVCGLDAQRGYFPLCASEICAFPFLIPAISPLCLRSRCFPHQAFSDLDCEYARDNSLAERRSNIREFGNSGPAPSFVIHGFPGR